MFRRPVPQTPTLLHTCRPLRHILPGQMLSFKAGAANTGASTLNVNGLGAKDIKKNGSADLAANDIKSGQVVTVIYDGTQFQMISQIGNASGGGNSGGGDPTLIYTTNGF